MRDYQRRRIDLELQRREHRRTAAKDCPCLTCHPETDVTAELLARVRANAERVGPPPF